jgi:hypothetical protein
MFRHSNIVTLLRQVRKLTVCSRSGEDKLGSCGKETIWLKENERLAGYHQEKESITERFVRTQKVTFFSLIKSHIVIVIEVGWDAGSASIALQNAKEGHSLILCGSSD